ncbi:MAG TPA: nucleotide disphospho-sugar-binding domain-containing protein [Chloroflexota bacterium]|nr:nucleotide disphospho-sugar-binding domain-containing protein [Chloroflexota bacterium]
MLRNVVAALSQLPVNAVLTAGPACDDLKLEANAHVLVVQSAPHDAILRQAALCITHCGHGTVMRALGAGVPILGMPMVRDQNDNAARIAWHGAGLRIAPDSAPEVIAGAANLLLQNPSFQVSARALGAEIRSELDPDRACRLLEGSASSGPSATVVTERVNGHDCRQRLADS